MFASPRLADLTSRPTVAGYEIINEPSPGFNAIPGEVDATELFPFYAKVIDHVVSSVPGFRQLFFIEPNVERDVTDHSAIVTPWSAYSSYPNVVYAPHVYTGTFTLDQRFGTKHVIGKFRLSVTTEANPRLTSPITPEQHAMLDTPPETRTQAQKDAKAATAAYERAAQLRDDFPEVYRQMGGLYLESHNVDAALKVFNEALARYKSARTPPAAMEAFYSDVVAQVTRAGKKKLAEAWVKEARALH